jgi:hypothetical protein
VPWSRFYQRIAAAAGLEPVLPVLPPEVEVARFAGECTVLTLMINHGTAPATLSGRTDPIPGKSWVLIREGR